jgi:hypothetical protein
MSARRLKMLTLRSSAVNFTTYGPKLPASNFSIYKLAFVVFLKLTGLCEEGNLSSQGCEAGS